MDRKDKLPIFVVGFPRSGTTLLSAMLSSHADIACGVETHFFSNLKEQDLNEAVRDPEWPNIAIRKISDLCLQNQRILDLYGVTEKELRAELSCRPHEKQELLDALLSLFVRKEKKAIWL